MIRCLHIRFVHLGWDDKSHPRFYVEMIDESTYCGMMKTGYRQLQKQM